MYLNDDDSSKTAENKTVIDGTLISPSPGKGSENVNDQMATLSILLGEIFRTLLIAILGIYAFYRKFSYVTTGSYFWVRSINSLFNIISHLFLFLVLGANVFTLMLTVVSFLFDGYLSYIVCAFWQSLNVTKASSISSSAQSEMSNRVRDNE